MKEPFTYFRIVITPLSPSVFDRSEVNYFYQTDLKASLEIRRPQMTSVKITENTKESADSKYSVMYIIQYYNYKYKVVYAKRVVSAFEMNSGPTRFNKVHIPTIPLRIVIPP